MSKTNLERYFGVRVTFKRVLDPLEISYLKTKALNITKLKGFDLSDFYVYVHSMNIHVDLRHFAHDLPIEERIKELEVRFCVNPKQVRTGQIKFYNEIIRNDLEKIEGIEEAFGDTELTKYYQGKLLNDSRNLRTELITYIDKNLVRESFRKIKVHVNAIPTTDYASNYLKNAKRDTVVTSIDLRFTKEVQLSIRFPDEKSSEKEEDYLAIALQLQLFKESLASRQDHANFSKDILLITEALEASHNKDRGKLLTALKAIGSQAYDISKSVGIEVLKEIAKGHLQG